MSKELFLLLTIHQSSNHCLMHEEQPIKGNLQKKTPLSSHNTSSSSRRGRVVFSPLILTPVEIAHNKDIAAASKEPRSLLRGSLLYFRDVCPAKRLPALEDTPSQCAAKRSLRKR